MPSFKKGINQQLRDTIYKKVTKENHKYESPQPEKDGTLKECIELFKKGADPEVLTKLEKSLRERIELEKSPKKQEEYQKHYKYYIKNFLSALKAEIMKSKVEFPVFNNEIEQSQRSPTGKAKILQTISDITKKSNNKDHSSSTIRNQNDRENSQISSIERSSDNETDSGINSPGLASSSRRSSISSTLSSVEGDNGLQPEDEGETKLAHLTKTRSKGPSGRRSPSKYNKKIEDQVKNGVSPGVIQVADTEIQREKNMDPDDQDTQKTGSQPVKSEEQKNTAPFVQKPSANKNNSKDTPLKKQPNNRNLHVALVAGCALSTIGCIVAGAMTSGLIGAGLLAMAAVFAIAAVAELHSNFLSSKLTSINVEPHVNDKELTAL